MLPYMVESEVLMASRGTITQIAKFMGPTRGPPGSCRPQMGPMLTPWTLLSGYTRPHARGALTYTRGSLFAFDINIHDNVNLKYFNDMKDLSLTHRA